MNSNDSRRPNGSYSDVAKRPRPAEIGASRRPSLRGQSPRRRYSLPPGAAHEWRDFRLSLGGGSQTHPAPSGSHGERKIIEPAHESSDLRTTRNLLPIDGIVNYFGPILEPGEARDYLDALLTTVPWRHDEAVIFGRHIVTARKVAWYGNENYAYKYSGTTKTALAWSRELAALKTLVEQKSGTTFNSCLLNLYHNGTEGMGWHSDDEKSLGKDTAIASLSLGAERKFALRHRRTGETISLSLEAGSLLIMKGTTQTFWKHCILKSAKIKTPRINLTFRSMQTNSPVNSRQSP